MQYGFAVDFNLKMYQYISHRYQCWSCEDPICESISPARMVPHCNGRTFNDYSAAIFLRATAMGPESEMQQVLM